MKNGSAKKLRCHKRIVQVLIGVLVSVCWMSWLWHRQSIYELEQNIIRLKSIRERYARQIQVRESKPSWHEVIHFITSKTSSVVKCVPHKTGYRFHVTDSFVAVKTLLAFLSRQGLGVSLLHIKKTCPQYVSVVFGVGVLLSQYETCVTTTRDLFIFGQGGAV